jgi:nicotinamidase/pyrazinamidase
MVTFLIFCVVKTVLSYTGRTNEYKYDEKRYELETDDDASQEWNHPVWKTQDYPTAKIAIALSVLFSWFHMYYYLMGFDSTGPIILTIFRCITNDVRDFLRFYLVALFAFACAISVLANQDDPSSGYGFKHIGWGVWNLLQSTVGMDATNFFPGNASGDEAGVMSLELVPQDMKWFSNILVTCYLAVSNILMVNLLIAMISNTYEVYVNFSSSILLMEKYNIMAMYERSLSADEMTAVKDKYSRVTETVEYFDTKDLIDAGVTKNPVEEFRHEMSSKDLNKRSVLRKRATKPIQTDTAFSMQKEKSQKSEKARRGTLGGEGGEFEEHRMFRFKFELCDIDENQWEIDEANESPKMGMTNTTVFIIDPQCDFHPEGGQPGTASFHAMGSLAVPGANEDSDRIATMIKANKSKITDIVVSMDSHFPAHIAHAVFWLDGATRTEHPPIFSAITHLDVVTGKWVPRDPTMLEWCKIYTFQLEQKGRMVLCIWPPHCIIGSRGHSVVPVINDALQEWCQYTGSSVQYVLKGQNLRCEMYSALESEVVDPLDNATALNVVLLAKLRSCGRVRKRSIHLLHCICLRCVGVSNLTNSLSRCLCVCCCSFSCCCCCCCCFPATDFGVRTGHVSLRELHAARHHQALERRPQSH